MDAHAHLKGLGWRGTGHSLDKTDRGLKKPLLISHKNNLHGLGSKSQKEKQADQWWLNAFDNALKDIGTGKESSLATVREHGVNRGGLYGFFVKGQILESTIEQNTLPPLAIESASSSTVSTDDEDSDSQSSTEISDSSDSESSTASSSESSSQSDSMGAPRRHGGFKRNTSLVNGANSMPLGKTRVFNQDSSDSDKKRKHEEEPVSVQAEKPQKKAKGADGNAVKSPKKEKIVKAALPIEAPPSKEKVKKSKKAKEVEMVEALPEPAEKEKTKKSKKSKKTKEVQVVETAPEPAKKEKTKKSKKGEEANGSLPAQVQIVSTLTEDLPSKISKKDKKKPAVVESEAESVIESEIDSEIDDDSSESESNSESVFDSGTSATDSDDATDVETEDDSEDDTEGESADESMEEKSETEIAPKVAIEVLKVVNGVPIPQPEIVIKEKKKKVPARVIREQRKEEREHKARQNALEKKKAAIADGTFDYEADERRKKERAIDKKVKDEIRRRENAGEFGPKLPHPATLLQIEKEIGKELKKTGKEGDAELEKQMMHERLIKMGVTGLNQNRKVKYKEEKFKREKLKRTAARDIKARERARVFGTEYIPESTLSEQDLKKKRAEEKLKAKAERKESRAKKALINEDKEAAKLQRREAKKLRREQKVENKRKTAEGIAALKAQKIATTASVLQRAQDVFAGGADEIKLGINVDGRTRTIPGVGRVTKYPTKAEKLKTKIEARAFEAGINYEEMKEKMDKEKAEKMAPEMERQTQIRTARGGLNSKQWHHYCTLAQLEGQEEAETFFLRTKKKIEERADAIANGTANGNISSTSMLDGDVKMEDAPNGMSKPEPASLAKPLSDMKKQKYAAKAVEKGMSLDVYITHHAAKKAKKEGNDGDEALALPTGGVTLPKLRQPSAAVPNGKSKANLLLAAAKSAISSNGVKEEIASTFVIDTTGDSNLKNARATTEPLGFAVDTSGDAEILTREKPALKWNPDMLGDRKVKELTKEERKARLEYMREKRMARHEAAGKIPLSKKERHKARVEKKQKQRNRLVAEIMTAKGKPKEDVSKEELEAARRAAKRVMREEKRVKRDKVIHRKKLGGGLRGQFGGSISMGGRS